MVQRTKRKRVSVILTPLENYTHFYWKGGGMTLEVVIRLLLVTELDRAEKEREITVKRIKDGIKASSKKSGRKEGQLDKMTPELEADIRKFLTDRSIKQIGPCGQKSESPRSCSFLGFLLIYYGG